jgi:hypothetical protein
MVKKDLNGRRTDNRMVKKGLKIPMAKSEAVKWKTNKQ